MHFSGRCSSITFGQKVWLPILASNISRTTDNKNEQNFLLAFGCSDGYCCPTADDNPIEMMGSQSTIESFPPPAWGSLCRPPPTHHPNALLFPPKNPKKIPYPDRYLRKSNRMHLTRQTRVTTIPSDDLSTQNGLQRPKERNLTAYS